MRQLSHRGGLGQQGPLSKFNLGSEQCLSHRRVVGLTLEFRGYLVSETTVSETRYPLNSFTTMTGN